MLVLQVFLFKNGQFLGNEMASGERLELGRDPNCDIVLDDESVSRRHAFLFEHDGKLAVQDAGSHLGTSVNGQLISTPRYISARDDVNIGPYTIKLKPIQNQPVAPSAPAFDAPPPTRMVGPGQPAALGGTPDDDETLIDTRSLGAQASAVQAFGGQSTPAPVTAAAAPPKNPLDTFSDLDAALDAAFPEAGKPTLVQPSPLAMAAHGEAPFSEPTYDDRLAGRTPLGQPPATPHSADQPATAHLATAVADTLVKRSTDPRLTLPPAPLSDESGPSGLESAPLATRSKGDRALGDFVDGAGDDDIPAVEWRPGEGLVDEDDDDEDEAGPPWSLVQALVTAPEPPGAKEAPSVVEVIHYRGERVLDHAELPVGSTFDFGRIWTKAGLQEAGIGKPLALVKHKKGGVAELVVGADVDGRLLREGQQLALRSLPEAQGKKGRIPLTQGDMASLELFGDRVFVRIGKVPSVAPTPEMVELEKRQRKLTLTAVGIAVSTWLMMFAVAWIAQYRALSETVIQLEDEGFAEVIEPELELEEPEPEPEEPKIEEVLPEPEEQKTAKKPDPEPPADKEAPKKPGVLDALKNIPKPANAGNQSLTAALSNVKGVRVPGASTWKVSSMEGKGPKGVQIGGASGGVDTNSLNSILRKGGGAGNLAAKRSRDVKGRVKTLKRESKIQGQGTLSKEEIQKVINKNVGKIQYCYEKQLRLQPGLSGKVVLEWTIGLDGSVKVVKSNDSTLKSPGAITCMINSLKGWQFPKPRGGTVIVKYPFIFNTL